MISWFALLSLLPLVFTFPLERRTGTNRACGQFDAIKAGPYTLMNNLWGQSGATSGSQCSVLTHINETNVRWHTRWNWTGGASVKSFANMQLNEGINKQLSAISTMQSHWHWGQKNKGTGMVVADVAYDFFTSYSAGGPNVHEVMVWLANYNAGPISYEYGSNGTAIPIATNLSIAGRDWDLYLGFNGVNEAYSFLPVQASSITTFSSDVYEFFTHLIDRGCVNSSEYLVTAQAGTETVSGGALFVTEAYSMTIT